MRMSEARSLAKRLHDEIQRNGRIAVRYVQGGAPMEGYLLEAFYFSTLEIRPKGVEGDTFIVHFKGALFEGPIQWKGAELAEVDGAIQGLDPTGTGIQWTLRSLSREIGLDAPVSVALFHIDEHGLLVETHGESLVLPGGKVVPGDGDVFGQAGQVAIQAALRRTVFCGTGLTLTGLPPLTQMIRVPYQERPGGLVRLLVVFRVPELPDQPQGKKVRRVPVTEFVEKGALPTVHRKIAEAFGLIEKSTSGEEAASGTPSA